MIKSHQWMLKLLATLALAMMLGLPAFASDGKTLHSSASVVVFENLHVHFIKGLHFGKYSRADRMAIKFWLHQDNGFLDVMKGTFGY